MGAELFDIGVEALAVDRSVEQAGRFDAVVAQRGEEGRGLPLALRNLVDEALSLRGPAAQTGHVGLRPGLVDEDQPSGVDEPLIGSPSFAVATDVRAILLARDEGLFLNVTPIRRRTAHHRGVGLDASLGQKAIAKRLKRDVRFLGPHRLKELPMRHELGGAMAAVSNGTREPSRSTRSSHLMATDSLIS